MKELLITLAKNLVSKPEHVQVEEERDGDIVTLRLKVADDDMGKVIGKQGRIARAIRTVVKAAAVTENVKVNVEIG